MSTFKMYCYNLFIFPLNLKTKAQIALVAASFITSSVSEPCPKKVGSGTNYFRALSIYFSVPSLTVRTKP